MPLSVKAEVNDSREYVSDIAAHKMRLVPKGTLLVSFKLTLGRLGFAGRDLYTNEAIASLLDLQEAEVRRDYLYWFLSYFDWDKAAAGEDKIKGKTLNKAKLKLIPILVPPLEEQKRIVAILDEAFAGLARARENAETNVKSAQDLFSSSLQEALADTGVDWVPYKLSELGEIVTGSTPKTNDPANFGHYLPFVKPGNFNCDGTLVYDNQGLSEKGAATARIVSAGSALMVCIGATIGKAGYADRPIATNQQINSITPREGIDGEYLYLQMLTPEFQAAVLNNAGQATLPIINKSKWSNLEVRLPRDPRLQKGITERLLTFRASVDAITAQYEADLDDIADLRQSLLHKAFSGELS